MEGDMVYLADIHAIAYWLSAKPKKMDTNYVRRLIEAGEDPDCCTCYLDGTLNRVETCAIPQAHSCNLTTKEARALRQCVGGWAPIHVMYGPQAVHRETNSLFSHRHAKAVPCNSYLQISKRVCVPIPELALLQAAPRFDAVELLVLIGLFCGVFCLGEAGGYRRPLTSVKQISDCLDAWSSSANPIAGAAILRHALKMFPRTRPRLPN